MRHPPTAADRAAARTRSGSELPDPLFFSKRRGAGAALLAALLLTTSPASAHRLKLFVTQAGAEIQGEAFFVGGGRPEGATVIIRDPAGQEVARLTTDTNGAFRWTPPHPDAYRIAVDCGDGHTAETRLNGGVAAPAAAPAPSPLSADEQRTEAAVERVLARRLDPLLAAQVETESRLRLNDVVGGIGYIVGLAGLGLAWAARRRKP